jgi:hypothetical protein
MYLIDGTYFIREYNVPNSAELQGNSSNNLEQYIDERCRLLLQMALGSELFTDLDDNITNGELDDDAPQKWKDLVNGVTYTKDGKDYVWKGLLQTEGTFKNSLLTPYVYYYWLKGNISSVLGVGEVITNGKNATNINSTQRLIETWNNFVVQYQGNCTYKSNVFIHNGVIIYDYYQNGQSNYVNFLQFIKDNETEYPDAPLEMFEFKNQIGL